MSNKIYELVERFYRSSYGMHRFLENYLGFEATLYTQGIANNTFPNQSDYYEKVKRAYGPSVNLTTSISPTSTIKIFFPIYSVSRMDELTSDLGGVRGYTFDQRVNLGDWLETNINNKKMAFKVESKKTIGYGNNIVFVLDLKPSNVVELNTIRSYRS